MKLQIAALVGRAFAANEAPGLGHVGTADTRTREQILQPDQQIALPVVGDAFPATLQQTQIQVVLQVLAHTRQRHTDTNAQFAQLRLWPDPAEQQQLR